MTYRSLLVFLDQDPLCAARIQVAIQLAKVLDCHLVGVAPTGLVDLPMLPEADQSLGEFRARAGDALRSHIPCVERTNVWCRHVTARRRR